jgi:DNA-binding NarL/FixJ family response regulator
MVPVRVVVADDSATYRTALCKFLSTVPDIEVAAAAQDGVEALDLIQQLQPDALFLDIEMPKMNGWEVLQCLQMTASPVQVLMLSSHAETYFQKLALERGASAFINKGNVEQVIDTIDGLVTGLKEM